MKRATLVRSCGMPLTGVERCDRLVNANDLPLVHIEIFIDGFCREECSAAAGALGEFLKALFDRTRYSHRKGCFVGGAHMYTFYHGSKNAP
jgi:hypothetical protein